MVLLLAAGSARPRPLPVLHLLLLLLWDMCRRGLLSVLMKAMMGCHSKTRQATRVARVAEAFESRLIASSSENVGSY